MAALVGKGAVSYNAMQAFWNKCGPSGNLTNTCESLAYQTESNVGPY